MSESIEHMLGWIRGLAVEIGARGSCTPQQKRAGDYVMGELRRLGAREVTAEPFRGAPSTYRPFALAFGAGLLGSLLALLGGAGWPLALGAVLSGLGAWAMLAETDFAPHWARWILPTAPAQNVTGRVAPAGPVQQRAVLCAHIDTHRSPVFYSSEGWLKLFSLLVGGTFASMALGALLFAIGLAFGWDWLGWAGLPLGALQLFALGMMLAADFTPFNPGANDNASGVAVSLAIVERLAKEPLQNTEVHLALTDCEETGASGAIAYFDAHAAALGPQTTYIMLDQVGQGVVNYLTADGLILKHATHPAALDLARRAAQALPDVRALEMVGSVYTDALPATKRGLSALTLCCVTEDRPEAGMHWHQMDDTIEFIEPQALEDVYRFTWQVLLEIDRD